VGAGWLSERSRAKAEWVKAIDILCYGGTLVVGADQNLSGAALGILGGIPWV